MTNSPHGDLPSVPSGRTEVAGIEYNLAGALAYFPICFINVVASVVWLRTEPDNNEVLRFQSMQSLVFSAAFAVVAIGCGIGTAIFMLIPFVQLIMVPLMNLSYCVVLGAYIIVNIIAAVKAYNGETYKIPVIGDFTEKRIAEFKAKSQS